MKRAIFLAAAVLAQASLASIEVAQAQPLSAPSADWSGPYAGVFAGIGMSDGRASLQDYAGSLLTLDVSNGLFPRGIGAWRGNALFGMAVGFNVQSGAFVGGIEADLAYSNLNVQNTFSRIDPGPIFPGVNTNTLYHTQFGGLGSLRLRFGYLVGAGTLVYATVGLAAGQVHNRLGLALPELNYSKSDWSSAGVRVGYVIGAGLEHRLSREVSLKFEVLYYDLQNSAVRATDQATFPGESFTYRYNNNILTQRLGMNVRF